MSQANIHLAIFEEIGDFYILELDDITNAIAFLSFQEIITNATASRTFIRDFKYSINNNTPSGWITLSNANLAAIPVSSPANVYKVWIRYIRTGADSTGTLIWNRIQLNINQANVCITLKVNQDNWTEIYGGEEKFMKFNEQIQLFNRKYSIPRFNTVVYVQDDDTVPSAHIHILRASNSPCLTKDVNILLKELWGNYLVDFQFKIGIDTYDGIPTP